MDVDAAHGDAGQFGGAPVERERLVEGDPELALLESGGNVGMRLRIDVGIDANAYRRPLGRALGDAVEVFEFALGFNVEAQNVQGERLMQLFLGLSDAGKDDLGCVTAGGDHPRELTT